MPVEDIIKGMRPKETSMPINYLINSKQDIGQRTMINWAKKDRLPTRGIHIRGECRRERMTKNYFTTILRLII